MRVSELITGPGHHFHTYGFGYHRRGGNSIYLHVLYIVYKSSLLNCDAVGTSCSSSAVTALISYDTNDPALLRIQAHQLRRIPARRKVGVH